MAKVLDDTALIDELATPHRAGPAYEALMARGPAAAAAAAQKYRDSTPAGSEARPVSGQPKILQSPAQ